ncbi:MAG: hypothetical protein WC895_05505 [Candidatus Shapirobacteria bacterium]|jgi:hypothetical protein
MDYKDHGNGVYVFKKKDTGYPVLPAFAEKLSEVLKEHPEFEVVSIIRDSIYFCVVFKTI